MQRPWGGNEPVCLNSKRKWCGWIVVWFSLSSWAAPQRLREGAKLIWVGQSQDLCSLLLLRCTTPIVLTWTTHSSAPRWHSCPSLQDPGNSFISPVQAKRRRNTKANGRSGICLSGAETTSHPGVHSSDPALSLSPMHPVAPKSDLR